MHSSNDEICWSLICLATGEETPLPLPDEPVWCRPHTARYQPQLEQEKAPVKKPALNNGCHDASEALFKSV
jgi:hypothetical protein